MPRHKFKKNNERAMAAKVVSARWKREGRKVLITSDAFQNAVAKELGVPRRSRRSTKGRGKKRCIRMKRTSSGVKRCAKYTKGGSRKRSRRSGRARSQRQIVRDQVMRQVADMFKAKGMKVYVTSDEYQTAVKRLMIKRGYPPKEPMLYQNQGSVAGLMARVPIVQLGGPQTVTVPS